jgi:hypothetical protein
MFQTDLIVKPTVACMWQLVEPLIYDSHENGRIVVPKGFLTDLASIPPIFTPALPINDLHRPAAVVHDMLYTDCAINGIEIARKVADGILYEAMEDVKETEWKARVIYAGVRVGGWLFWGKHHPLKVSSLAHARSLGSITMTPSNPVPPYGGLP